MIDKMDILNGMMRDIHYSKTLKREYPNTYAEIMANYPGHQPKEKIWNFCNESKTIQVCHCGKAVKFSNSFKTGYNKFCSVKCSQSKESAAREAHRRTMLQRYGTHCNFSHKTVIEQKKKTWMQKYGVTNPAKSTAIKEKILKTKMTRYGEQWVKNTFTRNMQKRYGVDNWVQVPELYSSFSAKHSNKQFIFPSGHKVHIQGYEGWALDILLQKYSENELKVHIDVPTITYEMDNKELVHYPDIFVPGEKMIIEVKSTYTYKSLIIKNHLKAEAATNKGFRYQFWVFDGDKNLEIIEYQPQLDVIAKR